MNKLCCLLPLLLLFPAPQRAQHTSHGEEAESHFRGALLLSHTLVTPGNAVTRLFVPSWRLDLKYWGRGKIAVTGKPLIYPFCTRGPARFLNF